MPFKAYLFYLGVIGQSIRILCKQSDSCEEESGHNQILICYMLGRVYLHLIQECRFFNFLMANVVWPG